MAPRAHRHRVAPLDRDSKWDSDRREEELRLNESVKHLVINLWPRKVVAACNDEGSDGVSDDINNHNPYDWNSYSSDVEMGLCLNSW